ncbi:MAG: DoxX family protein [Myxococcota bacterium]
MSKTKLVLLRVMAAFYVFAGIQHFRVPHFYLPMMPPYLPWHAELVLLSGVAELLCGIGVLIPATRKYAAWATIALLVAVFPANIHVAFNNVPVFGATEGAGPAGFIRLPFQLVLIAWAWWYTRD